MSTPNKPSTSGNPRRRPSSNASNPALDYAAGPMMWPMSQMFNPYMMASTQAMAGPSMAGPSGVLDGSRRRSMSTKPWESSEDSDEDDFVPAKKRKGLHNKQGSKKCGEGSEKRGPGRPSKAQLAEREKEEKEKIVAKYPPAYTAHNPIAYTQKDECAKCKLYVGKVAFDPCGHCRYCYSCVNQIRLDAIKLRRPAKCPAEGCYELVEGWIQLFNVSA